MKKYQYFVVIVISFALFLFQGCADDSAENTAVVEGQLIEKPKEGTIYATWVNVWNSDLESWWRSTDSGGITVDNDGQGTWKSINWRNATWRKVVYDDLVDAGIQLIITDNTNGKFQNTRLIAEDLKAGNWDLQYCVALKRHHMEDAVFMQELSDFMEDNPFYYRINGRPIIIAYVVHRDFLVLKDIHSEEVKNFPSYENFKKFDLKWAAGEITKPNKWGWQLEPQDGYAAGAESALVTPSVKHTAEAFDVDKRYRAWSRSMAFLDYSFALARTYKPDHIIVGSYDDVTERNGWMTMNTSKVDVPGTDMYSPWTGDTSDFNVFRERTEDWIKGDELEERPGGNLPDGIYRIRNKQTGEYLRSDSDPLQYKMKLGMKGISTHEKFVLYHISNKEYRIVNVYTGLPLKVSENMLFTEVWSSEEDQLFTMQEASGSGAEIWTFEPMMLFNKPAQSKDYMIKVKSTQEYLIQHDASVFAIREN